MTSFDPVHKPTVAFYTVITLLLLAGGILMVEWYRDRDQILQAAPTEQAVRPAVPAATAQPTPTPTPTPTATPTATPTETATVSDEDLAEARASDAWPALAEWDRIDTDTMAIGWYLGGVEEGVIVAAFNDPAGLWNQVMPGLRDELLREWVAGEIEPVDVRFRGKPYEDEFESGVLGWWTNACSGGRGYMRVAYAAYVTSDGDDRMRVWPIMIDPGFMPQGFVDAEITSVGPAVDLDYDEFETVAEANALLNAGWDSWFESQPVIYDAVNPPEVDIDAGG